MAYFAELDDNNTVLQVISVSNADAPDPAPEVSEPLGQAFIASSVWQADGCKPVTTARFVAGTPVLATPTIRLTTGLSHRSRTPVGRSTLTATGSHRPHTRQMAACMSGTNKH
jgi:hypothetical protein